MWNGICKSLNSLLHCVAVMMDVDNGSCINQNELWAKFRTSYPNQPFTRTKLRRMHWPSKLHKRPTHYCPLCIVRPVSNDLLAEDRAGMCDLTTTESNQVGYVSLFLIMILGIWEEAKFALLSTGSMRQWPT